MLSEKPWKLVDFLVVMALLCTMFLMGVVVNLMGQAKAGYDTAIDPTIGFVFYVCVCGVIVGFIHLMVRSRGANWGRAFGFRWAQQTSALLAALGVTLIVFPTALFLRTASAEMMDKLQLQPVTQPSVEMLQTTVAIAPQIYLAIQAVVFAPLIEELLFRGILYPFIRQQGYPKLALLGTSVLFGALHLNMVLFVPMTFLGLMLVWLYEKTDNLAAPIFSHSLFNLANFLWAIVAKQAA